MQIILIELLSGFTLLLYGIKLFNINISKLYNVRIRNLLKNILHNQFLGILLGIVLTVFLETSSVITVLVVALVQSRFLTIKEVCGLIIGANIGTSLAAFHLLDSSTYIFLALIFAGLLLWFFSTKATLTHLGEALISLSFIILGLYFIRSGLYPITEHTWFMNSVIKISQPLYGIPLGIGITTLMQSSTVSNSLVEKIANTGSFSLNQYFPFIMGNNIGTTTTALLAGVKCNREAKRTAMFHFLFNFIGMLLFLILLRFPLDDLIIQITDNQVMQIRYSHLLFNTITAVILFPFTDKIIQLACFFIPDTQEDEFRRFKYIQDSFSDNPKIIVEQSKKEIVRLGKILMTNLDYIIEGIDLNDDAKISDVIESKKNIAVLCRNIVVFLSNVEIKDENFNEEKLKYQDISTSLSSIHDSVSSIACTYLNRSERRIIISQNVRKEMKIINQNIRYSLEKSIYAFENEDDEAALDVIELREFINKKIRRTRLLFLEELDENKLEFQKPIVILRTLIKLNHISIAAEEISRHIIRLK